MKSTPAPVAVYLRFILITTALVSSASAAEPEVGVAKLPDPHSYGRPAGLPRPSELSLSQFERILFDFVNSRQYVSLGWLQDKAIRDTGPFLNGKYYGTHPAVRIFYSPEIIRWLIDGRRGAIPDGAMIIKEQFEPPAARHAGKSEAELLDALSSWTIVVKDSRGSHDGWFWSNPGKGQRVVDYTAYPFEEPFSGFGLYCVRCHASTRSPAERSRSTHFRRYVTCKVSPANRYCSAWMTVGEKSRRNSIFPTKVC